MATGIGNLVVKVLYGLTPLKLYLTEFLYLSKVGYTLILIGQLSMLNLVCLDTQLPS